MSQKGLGCPPSTPSTGSSSSRASSTASTESVRSMLVNICIIISRTFRSQMFCSRLSTGLKMQPRLRRLPDYQMMGLRRECIAVIHRKVHGMGRSIYAGRSVENTSERVCVTVNCSVVLALMILVLSDAFADSKENIRIDMRV